MGVEKNHKILISGKNYELACRRTLEFFNKSMLLHYDHININQKMSHSGADEQFWPELDDAINSNKQVLQDYLNELQDVGCQSIDDLLSLPLGYPSKVLHIIAHLLDGFIGIDTVFYNLLEDSHGLSSALRDSISQAGEEYWLLQVEAGFSSIDRASTIHKR